MGSCAQSRWLPCASSLLSCLSVGVFVPVHCLPVSPKLDASCIHARLLSARRWENWGNIVRDDELGIKLTLRVEAGIAPDYDSQEVRRESTRHSPWCSERKRVGEVHYVAGGLSA